MNVTALLIVAIGVFMIIAGFTGRGKAVLSAFAPQFARTTATKTTAA